MPQTPQTFKNHTRLLPPFHFFVLPVLFINFLNEIRHVYLMPSTQHGVGARRGGGAC